MTVDPDRARRNGFRWILPETRRRRPRRPSTTDANGFAQFQWEPDPPEADSAANVVRGAEAGLHRRETRAPPTSAASSGTRRATSGSSGRASPNPAAPVVRPRPDRAGDRHLHGLQLLRLRPGHRADEGQRADRGTRRPRSAGSDHLDVPRHQPRQHSAGERLGRRRQCGPVQPVPAVGPQRRATPTGNGLLDPGETWLFRCQQGDRDPRIDRSGWAEHRQHRRRRSAPTPTGTEVTDDATDDVDAFNPAILLTKLVNGQSGDRSRGARRDLHLRRDQHRQHPAGQRHARRRHSAVPGPDAWPRRPRQQRRHPWTSARPGPTRCTCCADRRQWSTPRP